MLHDWGVIAAAFAYIGLLFFVASHGDRLSPSQRGRAGMMIYPLSLAIYCTSWTFFGSVGFATRTSVDFLAIYIGPILMIGLVHAAAAPRDPARQVAEHHLDRRLHRRALRQEPGGGRNRGADRDHRIGALHRAPAQGDVVLAGDDPERGQGLLLDPDHRRHRAGGDAGDGGVRGAVRNPADRRHRTPARPDAGDRHRIHRQAGGLSRRRPLRHLLDVLAGRTDRTRDEDPGSGARDRLHALDRQFPDHDAAVVLRDHAAAAAVSRQRGREFLQRRGQPRALAVSALSGRHQPVRDPDRDRRPHHLPVRRHRQRHVRAGAADRGKFSPAQRRRLRRRPVGGDRDGDRGMRRTFHHGLERHRAAAGAAAKSGTRIRASRISATSCSRCGALRSSPSW